MRLGNNRVRTIVWAMGWVLAGLAQVSAADDLKRRALVGVHLAPLNDETRGHLKIELDKGVVFTAIVPNSAAERAGLKPNDVLVRLNDETVEGLPTFGRTLRKYGAGDTVKFTVIREGQETPVDVTLAPRPMETPSEYDVVYDSAGPLGKRVRTILTKPKEGGKHPVVVLMQRLGPNSVELTNPAPNPFRSIIEGLTKAGFATMRVERRGVGDSEGADVHENTIETDIESFRSAVQKVSSLDFVDPGRVFLFAHSSGAAIAPAVARELPVRGIATFAAFARPWDEHSLESSIREWKLEMLSEEQIKTNTEREKLFNDECYRQKKSPKDVLAAHPELKEYTKDLLQDETLIFGIHYRYMQQLTSLNLVESWSKNQLPVLALWGESDFAASKADSELIAATVNKAKAGKAKALMVPQTDHFFGKATDQEEAYLAGGGGGGGSFNPAVIEILVQWMKDLAA